MPDTTLPSTPPPLDTSTINRVPNDDSGDEAARWRRPLLALLVALPLLALGSGIRLDLPSRPPAGRPGRTGRGRSPAYRLKRWPPSWTGSGAVPLSHLRILSANREVFVLVAAPLASYAGPIPHREGTGTASCGRMCPGRLAAR